MTTLPTDPLVFSNLSSCDDVEFINRLSVFSDIIKNSSINSINSKDIYNVFIRCLRVIELKIKESYSKETFASFANVLKCISEILKTYHFIQFKDCEKIEHLFKLTAIVNENDLSTDIDIQIQCLHCLLILVNSNYSGFMGLFKKFNEIEMIKNLFGSVEIKVQSLAWKLIRKIIQKDLSSLKIGRTDLLLEIISDIIEGDTNLKIKIMAADVFLNILFQHNNIVRILTKFEEVELFIQILLNQVHFEHQEMVKSSRFVVEKCLLMTKYLWCLLQLIIEKEEKQFFRDIGGIPIILSLLSLPNEQLEFLNYSKENTDIMEKYFQIIEAASTFISTLSKNENNNLEIVQKSGIYLIAQHLVNIPVSYSNMNKLQKHLFRALRFLFSLERNRKKFKNIFPASLYEAFVDIGHFCENLDSYNQLITVYNDLSENERKIMKESVECMNQKEEMKCIRDYVILELLGSGAFGSVYKAKRNKASAGSYCAIKEVNLSECQIGSTSQERCDSIYQIASELDIIKKQLRHPHVVRYYRTFYDAQNLYVVMAFLEGISLGEQISCMKEKKEMYEERRIWNMVLQLVQALRYLHKSKGIIHRDLTPYNIIIGDKDYVTITDFGLAKQRLLESRGRDTRSILGTLTYVCPEVIEHQPYGEKADIWALGCIVYQMCTLTQPFHAQSELDLVNKICQGEYVTIEKFISPFTHGRLNYSLKAQTFVEHSIVVNPDYRYDVLELGAILVEEMLTSLDDIEISLSKENQLRKKLENQITETTSNKLSLYDMQFTSLQGSSREASPSVSSVNNQNLDDLNTDLGNNDKCTLAISPDFLRSETQTHPNQNTLSLSLNRSKISKFQSLYISNTGHNSELNLKKTHLQSPISEVRLRPLSSKSLMSISQKSLRHIAEDPITRMLTWLHKIYFLSRADFQSLKTNPQSSHDLVQTKRYFKTIFESIFKLQPNQMKNELNNIMSGRDSSLKFNSLPDRTSTGLSNISSEKLHYLMDDLLEKLNYFY